MTSKAEELVDEKRRLERRIRELEGYRTEYTLVAHSVHMLTRTRKTFLGLRVRGYSTEVAVSSDVERAFYDFCGELRDKCYDRIREIERELSDD